MYRYLFPILWLSWATYWLAASLNAKVTARRESYGSRLFHIGLLGFAGFLLWIPNSPIPALGIRFLPPAARTFWLGAALTLAGLLFTVWARVHLGRNWSATITIKQDHTLITSGPYGLVRYPIYSGLLLAFVGFALARGDWRGIVAVIIAFGALWRKLRIEERWLREQFGVAYEEYRSRVAALIPFLL